MRRFFAAIVLLVLGCSDDGQSLSGRVQRLVLDRPDRGHSEVRYLLEDAEGHSSELRFLERFVEPVELPTGLGLRVQGHFLPPGEVQLGTRPDFAVSGFEPAEPLSQAQQAIVIDPTRAPPPRRLLVILMNFANDPRQPMTVDEARRKIFTGVDSTRAFFKEQSYGVVDLQGKVGGVTGDVFGWYTITGFNRPCTVAAWGEAALTQARAAGVDTAGYDNTVFFFPATDACPYLGLGQQPGKLTWINGASIATFNHELGHNLGTPHAGARACLGSSGERMTIDGTCRDSEYGNPFDVMGAGFHHTHAYNKAQARWLSGGNVVEADRDGVYTLLPQERPATGPQLLSILRDVSSYYHLEYRQPFGFDDFPAASPAVSGLIVVLGGGTRQFAKSVLLDMTPETTSFDDAPLGVGKTFEDRKAGVRITLLERTAQAAMVQVKFSAPVSGDGGADAVAHGDAGPDGDAGPAEAGAPADTARPEAAASGPVDAWIRPDRPVTVNPAPPPPAAQTGCSYAGGTAPAGRGTGWLVGLGLLGFLGRAGRRRRVPAGWAVLVALIGLGCGTEGLPPPNSTRPPTAEAGMPSGAGGAGGGGANGKPDGGQDAKADGQADVTPDGTPDAAATDGGDDGGDGGDGGGDVTLPPAPEIVLPTVSAAIEEVCARFAQVACARQQACAPRRQLIDYGTEEICRARRTRTCRAEFLITTRNEQPRDRTACTEALAAQSCRDYTNGVRLPACDPPGGTLGPGEACFLTAQCQRGLRCKIDADVCGTCQPAIAVGGDCGWWYGGCPVGTACYDDRCLAPRKLNESCQATPAPCERGLQCSATGCRAKAAAAGASCAEIDVCDPAQGLFCNLTTKVCDPLPAAVAAGERCATFSPDGAPLSCADDATCFATSSAVTAPRTCVPRVDIGGPCDAATGKECKAPGVCTRGFCVMPKIVMGGTYTPPACR